MKNKDDRDVSVPAAFRSGLLLLMFTFFIAPVNAAPNVVVSIAPVHSLVSEVMQGVAEPVLLIEGGQSPHTSYLTPSARRNIANADLLVWLGASFEISLAKAFAQSRPSAKVISLLAAPTIRKLPVRDSGGWEAVHHHNEEEDSDFSGTSLDRIHADPHLWLSTENAIEIVRLLSKVLVGIDPQNAEKYMANSVQVSEKIVKFKQGLELDLLPIKTIPYLVFHDAYHYFEDEFGLSPAGSVTLNPERKPGAKTIKSIKNLIVERHTRCLFSEPQFEPGLLRQLAADADINTGVLDPLGSEFRPGTGQWFLLMAAMRDDLLSCIRRPED